MHVYSLMLCLQGQFKNLDDDVTGNTNLNIFVQI